MQINQYPIMNTSSLHVQKKSVDGQKASKETTGKSSYVSGNEYARDLSKRYDFLGKTSKINGVPTTVSVSPSFLEKCAKDPEKMDFLENTMGSVKSIIEKQSRNTRMLPGNPVMTYASYTIDSNGNITMMSGCTNNPSVKKSREHESSWGNNKKEKIENRRPKARSEGIAQEKAQRKKTEEEIPYSATGRDIRLVSDSVWRSMSGQQSLQEADGMFDAAV